MKGLPQSLSKGVVKEGLNLCSPAPEPASYQPNPGSTQAWAEAAQTSLCVHRSQGALVKNACSDSGVLGCTRHSAFLKSFQAMPMLSPDSGWEDSRAALNKLFL